jgi:hypothetical protein
VLRGRIRPARAAGRQGLIPRAADARHPHSIIR